MPKFLNPTLGTRIIGEGNISIAYTEAKLGPGDRIAAYKRWIRGETQGE